MNRSFGTSSLPRACQYEFLRKSADVYFGGTAIGPTFSPASSRRCSAQVSSHASRLRSPESLYR